MGWDDTIRGSSSRRRPRRAGRASSDAERRALAKANAQPPRWTSDTARPGFAVLTVDNGRASASTCGGDRLRAGGRRRIAVGLARGGDRPRQRRRRGIPRAARRSAACVRARGRPDRRPSDSKLLVAHLSGERTPSNRTLVALGNEISDLIMRIGTVTVGWTPGDATSAAHVLVAEALAETGPSGPVYP